MSPDEARRAWRQLELVADLLTRIFAANADPIQVMAWMLVSLAKSTKTSDVVALEELHHGVRKAELILEELDRRWR